MKRLLRKALVLHKTGLANSTLYELIGRGKFPQPAHLSPRLVVWDEEEVDQWMADLLATRDDSPKDASARPYAATELNQHPDQDRIRATVEWAVEARRAVPPVARS